jgi:RHH-type proline utilization regulon transcriptional repressor/proline dehydrogenase/delta 1-pyrroline-5-carboxylate dehydrogenase
VRRLLENGANTSFVNRVVDENVPIRDLVADPCELVRPLDSKSHPRIPQPIALFGEQRKNSMGANLANENELNALATSVNAARKPWSAAPLVPGSQTRKRARGHRPSRPPPRGRPQPQCRRRDVATGLAQCRCRATGMECRPARRQSRQDP